MQLESNRTGLSLGGVALLAACACGTSAALGRLSGSFGAPAVTAQIHPFFVLAGGALIVVGLWPLGHIIRGLSLIGVALLLASEIITPPMSLHGASHGVSDFQIVGLFATLVAAVLLVAAFFRAYPSHNPKAAVTAMSGAAMAVGCNCCLVPMALTSAFHAALPAELWVTKTLTIYTASAVLMAFGLYRLRGPVPALMAVSGLAFLYFWLELPYSSMPAIMVNGINVNFVIKYPMMFAGALFTMSGFALAFRPKELTARDSNRMPAPAFGD